MFVLLDIDGVMVPAQSWAQPRMLSDGFAAFSPAAVQVLQQLMTDDTVLVLTTSHKSRYDIATWKNLFEARGLCVPELQMLDTLPWGTSRKEEILHWLDQHPASAPYLILDDDPSLHGLPDEVRAHLLMPSPTVGLTLAHLPHIQAIVRAQTRVVAR